MGKVIAALILRLLGWSTVLSPAPARKTVIIFYPHTSNWDFPLGVLFRAKHQLQARWAGKDTLFRWPFRALFIALGGIPINRRIPTGVVGQLVAEFDKNDDFSICLAPEGTRSKTAYLKSGFYRLAIEADVPVGLAFVDYRRKQIGIEHWITLSGNEAADLETIRACYADKTALFPEKVSDIRFKR
ncbi:MAG: 1-acyl-sn-glycerol-3-phosphate acyltransferase [Betaproteobacteria bacterium]